MPCDSQVATPYDSQSIASSISDISSIFPENEELQRPSLALVHNWEGFFFKQFGYSGNFHIDSSWFISK